MLNCLGIKQLDKVTSFNLNPKQALSMNLSQKTERVERAKRHRDMDMLLKGKFIHDGKVPKACSVGCDLIDISDEPWNEIDTDGCHAKVAAHDGTAEWIERLRDNVFEGLPTDKSSWWHVALAEALPEDDKRIARFGSDDWEPYFHAVSIAILGFTLEQKECWQDPYRTLVESAINQVIEYHMNPSEEKRSAAWSAADSARFDAESAKSDACYAAWSAVWSAADSDESAALSASSTARSSARSAARSSARSAARSAVWSAARSSARSAALSAARPAARSAWSAAYEDIAKRIIAVFEGNDNQTLRFHDK